ncbi:glutaredoxin family protein [Pontibacillus salicampi]|uniref:Glutaredoxin family protein n=1 Tax=Pontibacillus salicampi TaxID=1449801 RepID=A0ABV6LMW0_9BACI
MTRQNVVVYTSDGCRHCSNVLEFLEESGVQYEEKNISRSKEYYQEMKQQGVYGAPATFIGDQKILGFQKRQLKKKLGVDEMYHSTHQQAIRNT